MIYKFKPDFPVFDRNGKAIKCRDNVLIKINSRYVECEVINFGKTNVTLSIDGKESTKIVRSPNNIVVIDKLKEWK